MIRIPIGIGRPVSRDPEDVSKYVLKKMTPKDREIIEGPCMAEVLKILKGL